MCSQPAGEVIVTRCVHFNAAHRLYNPSKPDAWNEQTYGLCNNPQWHGHNYELEVSVVGFPDPETGYVIDLKELKDLLETRILQKCDHKNLNEQVDFLQGVIPTAENLSIAFWKELEPDFKGRKCRLHEIKLYETPRNFVRYRGA
jgi:6-pyruvoyltetrahydropterin/6-carboxytetrahydropterin synthase